MSDLISREKAISLAKDICVKTQDGETYRHRCIDPTELMEMPTVDAVPVRHGHWIMEFENEDGRDLRCSECRMKFYVGKGRDGNYCPNCGAKMDAERKEE